MSQPADASVYQGQPAQNVVPPHVRVWVEVEGQWRDLTCDGLGSLKIDGGRSDKLAENDATTMAVTLRWDNQGFDLPHLGDHIAVEALGDLPGGTDRLPDAALFYGRITDLAYEFPYLSIAAADPLADVEDVTVAHPSRPSETTIHRMEQYLIPQMKAANPAHDWLPNLADGLTPFVATVTKVPDWEELAVWDAIKKMLTYTGSAIFYQPNLGHLGSQGPEHWNPVGHLVPGMVDDLADLENYFSEVPVFSCDVIAADPPPRQFQSRAGLATAWRMTFYATDPTKDDADPGLTYTALAPQAYRDKYGIRRAKVETDLLGPASMQLAREWVSRQGVPLWNADNVQVLLTGPVQADNPATKMEKAWRVLAMGAGPVAQPCRVDLTGSGQTRSMVIEARSIEWRPDGWAVTLTLSHQGYYVPQFAVDAPPAQGPPQGGQGELRGNWRAHHGLDPGDLYVNDLQSDTSKANVFLAYEDADHRDQSAAARAIQDGQTVTLADTQGSWTISGTISHVATQDAQAYLGFRLNEAYQNGPPDNHLISVVIT